MPNLHAVAKFTAFQNLPSKKKWRKSRKLNHERTISKLETQIAVARICSAQSGSDESARTEALRSILTETIARLIAVALAVELYVRLVALLKESMIVMAMAIVIVSLRSSVQL